MGHAASMEDENCAQKFDEKLKRTDRVGNLGVNGGILWEHNDVQRMEYSGWEFLTN